MPALLFKKANLRSRAIRKRTAPNGRKVNLQTLPKEESGFQRFASTLGSKVQGWLGGTWQILKKNLPSVGEMIRKVFHDGVISLLTFDWNQSDEQIKEQIKQNNIQSVGAVGGVIGSALGSFSVLGVTYLVPKLGPMVANAALAEVTEQVIEDVKDALEEIKNLQINNLKAQAYMSTRAFLKNNDLARGLVQMVGGDRASEFFQQWGDGEEPWVIQEAIEEKIEEIPNPYLRSAVENGWEKFLERVLSTVVIISNQFDAYIEVFEQQKNTGNPHRKVKVKVDPESDSPPLIFAGRQKQLVPTIQSAIATGQMLYGKELRTTESQIAYPRSVSATGRDRYLYLECRNFEKPPYRRPNVQFYRWKIHIPNPRRGLSFTQLQKALGGSRGYYQFGLWRAIANLPSGKIYVRANSKTAATDRIEKLVELSEDKDKLKSLSIAEVQFSKGGGETFYSPASLNQKVYPYKAVLTRRRYTSDTDKGKLDLTTGQRYIDETETMELWRERPRYGGPLIFS